MRGLLLYLLQERRAFLILQIKNRLADRIHDPRFTTELVFIVTLSPPDPEFFLAKPKTFFPLVLA